MSGNGPRTGTRRSTKPTRRKPAAFRKIRAADRSRASYDPAQPNIKIPRKVIRAARISARRIIAAVTVRPRAMRKRWILRRVIVGFRCVSKRSSVMNSSDDEADETQKPKKACEPPQHLARQHDARRVGHYVRGAKLAQAQRRRPAASNRISSSSWVMMSAGSTLAPTIAASCPARRRISISSPQKGCFHRLLRRS